MRAVHERQREVEPAAHAARVAAHAAIAGLGEPDAVEQLRRPLAGLRPSQPVQRALHAQQLAAGHQRVDRRLLQGDADRPAHRVAVRHHVVPGHPRAARRRPQERGEDAHHRCLPGAVGTEEAIDLAVADLEVESVDGADAAFELAYELVDLDGGAHVGMEPTRSAARAPSGRSGRTQRLRTEEALLHLLGADHVHDRVDQREVREGLREVAEVAAGARVDLLGVEAERALV